MGTKGFRKSYQIFHSADAVAMEDGIQQGYLAVLKEQVFPTILGLV